MTITKEGIEKLVVDALNRALDVHDTLGPKGEELVKKNQFGETALRVDVEAEAAVISACQDANVPIKIVSEEHGVVKIKKNPSYLGILDGVDGTRVYNTARGTGRYGTMFSVFDGTDPRYDDYICAGVMEHSTRRLFLAVKNEGSYLIENGRKARIRCANTTELNKDTRIYVDEYFDVNKETFSAKLKDFSIKYLLSSCVYYVDVASGEADLALECTRKGNLEIAVAYGLIKESGGVIVGLDCNSIGGRKYLEFGQKIQIPVITAATETLARELIAYIQTHQRLKF